MLGTAGCWTLRQKTKWKASRKKGIGKGVAIAERSGAHFAQVIEVERRGKQIVPIKITTILDVGICINPDTVKAQTEGSILMGLGAVSGGADCKQWWYR